MHSMSIPCLIQRIQDIDHTMLELRAEICSATTTILRSSTQRDAISKCELQSVNITVYLHSMHKLTIKRVQHSTYLRSLVLGHN